MAIGKLFVFQLTILLVFAISLFHPLPAHSQNQCLAQIQFCGACGDPAIPGMSCQPEAPFLSVCTVPSNRCAPAGAAAETRNRCPNCGKPISLTDGNTYIVQNDVQVPGLGGGLSLTRTWNSMWPITQDGTQRGLFGDKWRSTYEERVFLGSDNTMKYSRADGSFWSFGYNGGTWSVAAPGNVTATLARGSSYWTLTLQNGEQRLFANTSGSLISIIDRNGNATQLSYDGQNRLVAVTDAAARHLYFSYPNDSTYLVSSVTSDVGISLSYSYDGGGRLIQATKPDNTTLSFEYVDISNTGLYIGAFKVGPVITAVKDSNGKLLESHTYDLYGRGTSSSRAGGAESLTITYPNPPLGVSTASQ